MKFYGFIENHVHNCAWQQINIRSVCFCLYFIVFNSLFILISIIKDWLGIIVSVSLNTAEYPCLYADGLKFVNVIFNKVLILHGGLKQSADFECRSLNSVSYYFQIRTFPSLFVATCRQYKLLVHYVNMYRLLYFVVLLKSILNEQNLK